MVSKVGAVVLALLGSASAAQADVTFGTSGGGICLPFSCADRLGLTRVQEIYPNTLISTPLTFNTLTIPLFASGNLETAQFSIFFSTSSTASPSIFSTSNLSANISDPEKFFGTFTLSGLLSTALTLSGNQISFTPSLKSLIMDVFVVDGADLDFHEALFGLDQSGTGATVFQGRSGTTSFNNATVATFSEVSNAPAPVPGAGILSFMAMGFAALRRRARAIGDALMRRVTQRRWATA